MRKTAIASGHAKINYQDIQVDADHIEANYETEEITARGRVFFAQGNRRLSGEALTFNLALKTGQIERINASAEGIFYRGESIRVQPNQWVITGSMLTTCNHLEPHYRITGREMIVRPGKSVTIRKAAFWYHDRRLLTLPSHTFSIAKSKESKPSMLPDVGLGPRDGAFLGIHRLLTAPDRPLNLTLDLHLTTHRGVRGLAQAVHTFGWGSAYLVTSRREDFFDLSAGRELQETTLGNMLVSRTPEAGFHLAPQRLLGGLTLEAAGSMGRVREFPTNITTNRRFVAGQLRERVAELGSGTELYAMVGENRYWYGTDQNQTISSFGLGLKLKPSRRLPQLEFNYLHRHPRGETPFRFDRIQIGRELGARTELTLPKGWGLGFWGRYDLHRNSFRDTDITISRQAHCLIYALAWRQARQQVLFLVRLAPFAAQEKGNREGSPKPASRASTAPLVIGQLPSLALAPFACREQAAKPCLP